MAKGKDLAQLVAAFGGGGFHGVQAGLSVRTHTCVVKVGEWGGQEKRWGVGWIIEKRGKGAGLCELDGGGAFSMLSLSDQPSKRKENEGRDDTPNYHKVCCTAGRHDIWKKPSAFAAFSRILPLGKEAGKCVNVPWRLEKPL